MRVKFNGRTPKPRIINVKQYTNGADRIIFDFDTVPIEDAVCRVTSDSLSQTVTDSGGAVIWDIGDAFTQKSGTLKVQLEMSSGDKVWKSDVMLLIVSESTDGSNPGEGRRLVYRSKTDGKERGIVINDNGIYRLTGDVLTVMYPIAVVKDISEAEALPEGTIVFAENTGGN